MVLGFWVKVKPIHPGGHWKREKEDFLALPEQVWQIVGSRNQEQPGACGNCSVLAQAAHDKENTPMHVHIYIYIHILTCFYMYSPSSFLSVCLHFSLFVGQIYVFHPLKITICLVISSCRYLLLWFFLLVCLSFFMLETF